MQTTKTNRFASMDLAPKKTTRKPKAKPITADKLRVWGNTGVGLMLGLSAVLNGFAFVQDSRHPVASAGMGIVIPVIVLILAKQGGMLWHRRQRSLAYGMGLTGAGLLLLSVWHVATAISLLTGSPLILALPMAVAIDVGMSLSELAVLTA